MPNNNTSATGGYLVETAGGSLEDQSLLRFLHDVIVGITCIENELVRPGWDQNPGIMPKINVDWVSYSITEQRPDNDPYQAINSECLYEMRRQEELDILCSFYGPNSQKNANIFRDGMYLTQNRDALSSVKMGLVGFGSTLHVPELLNDRFFDRYDIMWTIRREILREYPILNLLSAQIQIIADQGENSLINDFIVE